MNKILSGLFVSMVVWGCATNSDEVAPPLNDFKVHAYYVVPSDKEFQQPSAFMAGRALLEIQRWYQTSTGGLTFELLDEENLLEVYFTENPTSFYNDDWWGLLLNEMKENGRFIESSGTVALIWVEGIDQLSPDAFALGATLCNGDCGAAIIPVGAILNPSDGTITDLGTSFHELGHTFGLHHPLEIEDLPVSSSDSALLYSIMSQANIRLSNNNLEYGFLTNEKAALRGNKFLKPGIEIYQDIWETNIINYPVTGTVPEVDFEHDAISTTTISFTTNTSGALYYWYFGDGATSAEQNPSHSFASGLFNVTLMVTQENNMAARVSKFVEIL